MGAAVTLVDAVVATSSLKPKNWQIAIHHWMELVKGQYPHVTALPGFTDAMLRKISVMEPKEELLAGYQGPLSERDKVLINLYENARNEVKSVPRDFTTDLQTSVRLKLATCAPPDRAAWDEVTRAMNLTESQIRPWQAALQPYLRAPSRGVLRDVPDAHAIKEMIDGVAAYFEHVKASRGVMVARLAKNLESKAAAIGGTTKAFVEAHKGKIEEELGKGYDDAVALSSVGTFQNYDDWYALVGAIDRDKVVNYATLNQAIKDQQDGKLPPAPGKVVKKPTLHGGHKSPYTRKGGKAGKG